MNLFRIFQVNLTNEQINEVNNAKELPEWYKLYSALKWNPTQEILTQASGMYKKVAEITAKDLEDVFTISNIGKEEFINRLAPMSSISVGDIIVNENDDAFIVQPIGFKQIAF